MTNSSRTPQDLASATRAFLIGLKGNEPPADAIDQIGGWEFVGANIAAILDDPVVVPLIRLVARESHTAPTQAVLRSFVEAVLQMDSAAGFNEGVRALAMAPAVLDAAGEGLVQNLLIRVNEFSTLTAPTVAQASNAANALETVTRIRIGGYGTNYALLAAIEQFRRPQLARFAAAVVRCVGTAVDHWTQAADLTVVVKQVAGMVPPVGSPITGANPEDVTSDATWVLANIALVQALRADDHAAYIGGLRDAHKYLTIGADTYERDDSKVLAAVIGTVIAITPTDSEATIGSATTGLPTINAIENLIDQQAHFNQTLAGLDHWYTDVKRKASSAWVRLIADLKTAADHFSEESFYEPEATIDALLETYIATHSVHVVRRSEDRESIRAIVEPVIESGFASRAAFVANLGKYTSNLEARVALTADTGAATDPDLVRALTVAEKVLAVARSAITAGKPPGKGGGGTAPASLPPQLEDILGVGTPAAAKIAELDPDTVAKLVAAVEDKKVSQRVSLMESAVFGTIQASLAASSDYAGEVRDEVDALLLQLIRFVVYRQNAQEDFHPYLFSDDADEKDLHKDLAQYLHGAFGPALDIEVAHIGGGRVDLRLKYDEFSIFLELKIDATKKPLADIGAYVNQAATYQAADIRIGFLIALRTKAFPKGGAHPHVTSLFTHTTVDVIGDSVPRHLVMIQVPGNRSAPSSKAAK